ncbi:mannan endo-1,4-beta-mannosidase [Arcticibacter pallidicorallinus]|uniref:Mannan endo-1,4-beta-mannosidase n=1 Tax=Arcticibacter pallidicorallinus TaxID=1259464 RepID=A0A2T0U7W1_9SPHI|nr:glycosyl hydrolase [Arcticibacter pallidicorallinus]PRY53962.1 mannan endo-1,4-beta-mannosidase [Arcticibacter pallidicorallinus]
MFRGRALYIAALLVAASVSGSCKKSNEDTEAVTPVSPLPEKDIPLLAEVRTRLTDKNATDETVALFYKLGEVAKTNILFGHQDATKRGVVGAGTQWANEQQFTGVSNEQSDVRTVTGAYPAVYGFDFLHIANFTDGNWFDYERDIARKLTIEAYNRGGVCTYAWHYVNPVSKKGFYWSESPVLAVTRILPGGSDNATFKASLKTIADYAKTLIGADAKLVPIIFRPFHEMDGDWFWWGRSHCTPAEYQALYRYTVSYLRDELKVRNFLYAWSPDRGFSSEADYLIYYPGDAYVDLIGMDNYEDMKSVSSVSIAAGKLKIVSEVAVKKNKVAALTETGLANITQSGWFTQTLLKSLTLEKIRLSYVLVWASTKDTYWTPYRGHPAEADFLKFKNNAYVLFSDKMPTMYSLK